MLRILMIALTVFSVGAVAAEKPKYVEPDSKTVGAQQESAREALKQADTLSTSTDFLNDLKGQRIELKNVDSHLSMPGMNFDFIARERDDRYMAQALAAGKNIDSSPGNAIPLIMVSFSMPESQIKALIDEAWRVGGNVVVRGLIDGDFNKTIIKLRSMSQEKSGGVVIDPAAFKRFKVTTVPTFVLPLENSPVCTDEVCEAPLHVKASGSATLQYFLELVERTGTDSEKKIASTWLKKYGD